MADDVTYTSTNPAGPPDALKQATDEHATRGHMPLVKLAYSADGDATHIPADVNGLDVDVTRVPAIGVSSSIAIGVSSAPITDVRVSSGALSVSSIAAVGVSSIPAVGVSSMVLHDVRISSGAVNVSSIAAVGVSSSVAIGVSSVATHGVTQSGGWSIGVSSAPITDVRVSSGALSVSSIVSIGVSSVPAIGVSSMVLHDVRVSSGALNVSSIVAVGVSSIPAITQGGAWAISVSSITQVTSVATSTQSATASNFATFTAAGGLKNYVLGYSVFNTSSTFAMVDLRDGTAGAVLWSIPVPGGGGANLANAMPIFKTGVSTALAYDADVAVSTIYMSISGFQSA
jgi:hypothetical protein